TTTMAAAKVLLPSSAALVILFLVLPSSAASGTADGSEEWGYVEVRPKAHMFWCLYRSPQRVENGTAPWPTVLWLQGGPGASGTGYGNFMEIGPLDADLKPRATTWLSKLRWAVQDNPVGTGFSFVEGRNRSLMARTDAQAGGDLTALLIELYRHKTWLQGSPLYIVAESYGGKFAVTTALAALKAIRQGRLHAKLGGVALGDSWISPEDSVLSWGPLLYQLSRIDEKGLQQCNSLAQQIKAQLKAKQYAAAEKSWEKLESAVHQDIVIVGLDRVVAELLQHPQGQLSDGRGGCEKGGVHELPELQGDEGRRPGRPHERRGEGQARRRPPKLHLGRAGGRRVRGPQRRLHES
uniref:Carboxypeptidase n=1 Tax=Aegilops tauschii subsp. strangulata TaxID=200361 RepID=A0A453T0N5_AEGTS